MLERELRRHTITPCTRYTSLHIRPLSQHFSSTFLNSQRFFPEQCPVYILPAQ